jgi:uncharacterized protein YdaU (DUF1376 family)
MRVHVDQHMADTAHLTPNQLGAYGSRSLVMRLPSSMTV